MQVKIGTGSVDIVGVGPKLLWEPSYPVGDIAVGAEIPALGMLDSGWIVAPGFSRVSVFLVVSGAEGAVVADSSPELDGLFEYGSPTPIAFAVDTPVELPFDLTGRPVRSVRVQIYNTDVTPGTVDELRIIFT